MQQEHADTDFNSIDEGLEVVDVYRQGFLDAAAALSDELGGTVDSLPGLSELVQKISDTDMTKNMKSIEKTLEIVMSELSEGNKSETTYELVADALRLAETSRNLHFWIKKVSESIGELPEEKRQSYVLLLSSLHEYVKNLMKLEPMVIKKYDLQGMVSSLSGTKPVVNTRY